jgi:phosphatidylserine/phosphatidylglycerophosphate/cardiolipin synthase-like enzyme
VSFHNTLPGNWLLQTPGCFGDLVAKCDVTQADRGGGIFLKSMEDMIAGAKKSVELAGLWPPPDGQFRAALVKGLQRALQAIYPRPLTVRILIGVYPLVLKRERAKEIVACRGLFGPQPGANAACVEDAINTRPRELNGYIANEVRGGARLNLQTAYASVVSTTTWDHEKLLDVDGTKAIVGGMNYWEFDYLNKHPVTDVSMEVDGQAATDALRFDDHLWAWLCKYRSDDISMFGLTKCVTTAETETPSRTGSIPIITVGRLGTGMDLHGYYGGPGQSKPIGTPPVSGSCFTASNEQNSSRTYEYSNPGEDAIRALIAHATKAVFIAQQDLLSCLLGHEALFDDRLFQVLAEKVLQGVPITIVLSAGQSKSGSNYKNFPTFQIKDVASWLTEMVEKLYAVAHRTSFEEARRFVCNDVGLAELRLGPQATWPDGYHFALHAKVAWVDGQAFYMGSENLYPARLQELGYIVENGAAARQLAKTYLNWMWIWSREYAFIDPQKGICKPFGRGVTATDVLASNPFAWGRLG